MSEEKLSGTKWKKIHLLLTFAGIAVLPIRFGFWLFALETQPMIAIPSQKLPVPNAFDTLSTVGTLLADDTKIKFAINDRHFTKNKEDRIYSLREMQALSDENAAAIDLFRQSQKQAYMTPPVRSVSTLMPYLKEYRKLARLLILNSKICELNGNCYEAMRLRLDLLRFGNRVKRGGPTLHCLVGDAIERIGSQGIVRLCGKLSAKDAKTILNQMLEIKRDRVPIKEMLLEEKRKGQADILECFQKYIAFESVYALTLLDKNRKPTHSSMNYMFSGRRGVLRKYSSCMDESIAYSNLPYSSHPGAPLMPVDALNKIVAISTSGFCFKMLKFAVSNEMMILAFALKIYKDEHGNYPAKLSELVPAVLTALPEDPFALDRSFRYRINGDSYVLYSVGPDGKDDGGGAIENKTKSYAKEDDSSQQYKVEEDSKGDIVLGKNVK